MNIGDLKHRVDIIAQTRVADGMGGFTMTDSTIASSVAAAIWPVSANEIVQAQAPVMIVTHRIRIRYRSVMRASWRIKFGNRYFNIVSIIDPNMDHRWLDLLCKEATG